MAITMDELKKLLDDADLRYFIDPKSDAALLAFGGIHGRFEIVITLQLEGRFLQMRSLRYQSCPQGHRRLAAVHRLLAELNYTIRLVKFAWDPNDGEIVCYADIWLMDAGFSAEQLQRMIFNLVPALDESLPRIQQTLATGKDPGAEDPEALAARLVGERSRLPEPLRKLLDKLRGPKGEPDPPHRPKPGPEVGEL